MVGWEKRSIYNARCIGIRKIKIKSKTKADIFFKKPTIVASGQSCVVYDKDVCLGGGVVI